MTITAPLGDVVGMAPDMYQPQVDSRLLIDPLQQPHVETRTVLDLCTGSGVVVIRADKW